MLSRELESERARCASVDELRKQVRSLQTKELGDAREEMVARGYVLGGDGGYACSKVRSRVKNSMKNEEYVY
jgi:hypothetical protein